MEMIKLGKNIFFLSLYIIFICHHIDQVHTLRCAHSCLFGPTSFGSLDPIQTPCNTSDIDATTTICSVFLAINFEGGYMEGALNEKPRSVKQSLILHLSSMFIPAQTMTFINYQCATTDDCDEEFVRETVRSPKWFQLNETKVRAEITSLLFETNSKTDSLSCDNDLICSRDEQCVAELIQNSSFLPHDRTDFNNRFPCDATFDSQVRFDQHFHAPDAHQDIIMKIYCDKNKCNQRKIVDQVYHIIRNDFNLPLNYSAYIPISNRSCRINNFISTAVFLFFVYFSDMISWML